MVTGLDNLKIYKMAEEAELEVYKLPQKYPKDECFWIKDQLRSLSSAVTNNIAKADNKNSTVLYKIFEKLITLKLT